MAEVLTTVRLRLRPARSDDLTDIHAILSNAEAMRYWSSRPHTTPEESQTWLGKMIDADPSTSADFIVEYQDRVIGKCGMWRVPEIGYILHPDVWGMGLAREALAALLPHVFARFPAMAAIVADVDPRNERSLALLRHFGFIETGRAERTFQVGDEWVDSVYLSLARSATSA
jgi:ribosomal-protein-alanine N-acetyltransferase